MKVRVLISAVVDATIDIDATLQDVPAYICSQIMPDLDGAAIVNLGSAAYVRLGDEPTVRLCTVGDADDDGGDDLHDALMDPTNFLHSLKRTR